MRCVLVALLLSAAAVAADQDSDGDGLSDFAERLKHLTDPAKKDSDGDGKPDGDWDERREYAYSVRLVVRVLRPAAAISDDHQDARVIEEGPRHVTLEVICYPFSESPVEGNPRWRGHDLGEWVKPGLTANWDEELRRKIEVKGVRGTDDKELAERAAAWLLEHARYDGSHFTGFITEFVDGKPRLAPWATVKGPPIEEQWQRDLFAKGMFLNAEHGDCTSTAIYLAGCLRALGLPTRLLYGIPPVDGTDAAQVALLRKGITHHRTRKILVEAAGGMEGWTSHTFDEVFVGGRWRRLNYSRLVPPPLDPHAFGLLIPVLRLHDWSDAKMSDTVGRRQTLGERDELFPNTNPYVALEISDLFGAHAKVANEPVQELTRLTIVKAFWYADRPQGLDMTGLDEKSGHLFVQVQEAHGNSEYKPFYDAADNEFVLRAARRPDVVVHAERGYWGAGGPWGSGVFYLRIAPDALGKMARGVPYALVARNRADACTWVVADGVTLSRAKR